MDDVARIVAYMQQKRACKTDMEFAALDARFAFGDPAEPNALISRLARSAQWHADSQLVRTARLARGILAGHAGEFEAFNAAFARLKADLGIGKDVQFVDEAILSSHETIRSVTSGTSADTAIDCESDDDAAAARDAGSAPSTYGAVAAEPPEQVGSSAAAAELPEQVGSSAAKRKRSSRPRENAADMHPFHRYLVTQVPMNSSYRQRIWKVIAELPNEDGRCYPSILAMRRSDDTCLFEASAFERDASGCLTYGLEDVRRVAKGLSSVSRKQLTTIMDVWVRGSRAIDKGNGRAAVGKLRDHVEACGLDCFISQYSAFLQQSCSELVAPRAAKATPRAGKAPHAATAAPRAAKAAPRAGKAPHAATAAPHAATAASHAAPAPSASYDSDSADVSEAETESDDSSEDALSIVSDADLVDDESGESDSEGDEETRGLGAFEARMVYLAKMAQYRDKKQWENSTYADFERVTREIEKAGGFPS